METINKELVIEEDTRPSFPIKERTPQNPKIPWDE